MCRRRGRWSLFGRLACLACRAPARPFGDGAGLGPTRKRHSEDDGVCRGARGDVQRSVIVASPVSVELRRPEKSNHAYENVDRLELAGRLEPHRERFRIGIDFADDGSKRGLAVVRRYNRDQGRLDGADGFPVGTGGVRVTPKRQTPGDG